MKCIRCGDEIQHPDSSNAKYITNAADVRTHGPIVKETYVHKKGAAKLKTFDDINAANADHEAAMSVFDEEITAIRATFPVIDINDPVNDKTTKSAQIGLKLDQINAKRDEKKLHKIVINQETIQIPKTGIICRKADCQDAGDTVIWG